MPDKSSTEVHDGRQAAVYHFTAPSTKGAITRDQDCSNVLTPKIGAVEPVGRSSR